MALRSVDAGARVQWMIWAASIGTIVAVTSIVGSVEIASHDPSAVGGSLLVLGAILSSPGVAVFALVGGVHGSGLPSWAAVLLVSLVSGAVWASVIRGAQRLRRRQA